MQQELNKLKWRCQRGTLELDIICQRYLQQCYLQADAQEKNSFLQLLTMEDSDLIHFFLGDSLPEDKNLSNLVIKMRQLTL